MSEELSLVDWDYSLDGLELDDYGVFDEKVDSISSVELHPLIHNRQLDLCADYQSTPAKLERQTRLVRALQKTGPKMPMHFDRGVDDKAAQLVQPASAHDSHDS